MRFGSLPAEAWQLMPSCKIRRVTIAMRSWYGWYISETGTRYKPDVLFTTREAAINAGELRLKQQHERHANTAQLLETRKANLDAEKARSE